MIKESVDIIQFVENNRIIPEGLSPIPGYYRYSQTPYLREIVECFNQDSSLQIVDVMKGAQIGATVGLDENIILYIIAANPGPTLFLAQTAEAAETIFETRLEPAIDNAGLRHLIKSQSKKHSSKATGDTKSMKYFHGGFIQIAGLQTVSKLKSFSIKTLIVTEVDEAKSDIKGQGDPISIAERRLDSFSSVKKILIESTPTVQGASIIESRFNLGDKRFYHVPCKACGKLQKLDFAQMRYSVDVDGFLIENSVYYECQYCCEKWTNSDKDFFLKTEADGGSAKWIASSKSTDRRRRSYHISSLYSPIGFRDWASICEQYIQAESAFKNGDSAPMKVFCNQVLGQTWQEVESAPAYQTLYKNNRSGYLKEYLDINFNLVRSTFDENNFKNKPLFCTVAADIQTNYIETAVVLWGREMESWTIGYHRLAGKTENSGDRCWSLLEKIIKTEHSGFYPIIAFIDSGFNTSQVVDFCEKIFLDAKSQTAVAFPIKGQNTGRLVSVTKESMRQPPLIKINVDFSKQEVYARLALEKTDEYPMKWCHFATDFDIHYFKMLVSEERRKKTIKNGRDSFEWVKPKGRRNEALDIFGYNIAAAYFLCDNIPDIKNNDGDIQWNLLWQLLDTPQWLEFAKTNYFA